MTITFLDLYNAVSAQAWSMFDADAESKEDFETAMSTSIQKAVTEIWCSYNFPFRIKKQKIKTKAGKASYVAPDGNIIKKTVSNSTVYSVKIGNNFLSLDNDYETHEAAEGLPTSFYTDMNNIYLYPTPDDVYEVEIEYATLSVGYNADGEKIYNLEEDGDYIDIPAKYETILKNCLITKAMMYVIASETDENYSGYKAQYDAAYKVLMKYATNSLPRERRIVW